MADKFEDLIIRQQSKTITISIYKDLEKLKDYWYKDQIQRASVSIMNNIAEGYDRSWELDRKKFFTIAKSSCAEVRSMIILWFELWYLDLNQKLNYENLLFWLSKMIYNLIQKIN